jgi:hypothetical protein
MFSTMGLQLANTQWPLLEDWSMRAEKTRSPVIIVDEITESGRVNDSQMQTNAILIDIYA